MSFTGYEWTKDSENHVCAHAHHIYHRGSQCETLAPDPSGAGPCIEPARKISIPGRSRMGEKRGTRIRGSVTGISTPTPNDLLDWRAKFKKASLARNGARSKWPICCAGRGTEIDDEGSQFGQRRRQSTDPYTCVQPSASFFPSPLLPQCSNQPSAYSQTRDPLHRGWLKRPATSNPTLRGSSNLDYSITSPNPRSIWRKQAHTTESSHGKCLHVQGVCYAAILPVPKYTRCSITYAYAQNLLQVEQVRPWEGRQKDFRYGGVLSLSTNLAHVSGVWVSESESQKTGTRYLRMHMPRTFLAPAPSCSCSCIYRAENAAKEQDQSIALLLSGIPMWQPSSHIIAPMIATL
ncbi:uncharacterized protein RSE6_05403 [Rhynchosporium secalis]|uniref:Uncharacterized protein n=1 Tax=Rhynchosporium secalis TaxID=38038 RepID=A0A1E1M7P6_RHYSE|nr:uncharacterized protein RSE6_05403 [Rhynchosporium secalis]